MSLFIATTDAATSLAGPSSAASAKIIKIDADDLFLRINCDQGFHDLFQKSLTYTALHRRPYSPPLEAKNDRLVNLRNVCETFEIPWSEVGARLEAGGCRSIAHLALLGRDHLERMLPDSKVVVQHVEQVVSILNHSPVEPLYSLKRYWHDRETRQTTDEDRKYKQLLKDLAYLHLEGAARFVGSQLLSHRSALSQSHPFIETGGARIYTLLTFNSRDPKPFRVKKRASAMVVASSPAAETPLYPKDMSVPPPSLHYISATPTKNSKRPLSTSSNPSRNHSPRTPSKFANQNYNNTAAPLVHGHPPHRCLNCGKETNTSPSGSYHKYCGTCHKERNNNYGSHSSTYSSGKCSIFSI